MPFLLSLLALLAFGSPAHAATPARVDQVQSDDWYPQWKLALERRQALADDIAASRGGDMACGSSEALRQADRDAHDARMQLLASLRQQGLSPSPPPPGIAPWPWSAAAGQPPTQTHFDRDNVSVLVDDGTFVFINLRANPEVDEGLAAQAFYANHDDEYDFLVLYTDFFTDLFEGQYRAFHLAVANRIGGLGYQNTFLGDSFNDRRHYTNNTEGVLQSFVHLNDIRLYPEDPDQTFLRSYSGAAFMMHELSHRWTARLYLWKPLLGPLPVLLGRGEVHWGFFTNSGGSFNDGVQWVADGDRYRTAAASSTFGPLDLYLMGLLEPSEIDESQLFYLESPTDVQPPFDAVGNAWNSWSPPQEGVTCRATRVDFDLDGIYLANGVRRPVAPNAADLFTAATVLVIPADGSPTLDADIARINTYQTRLGEMFHQETRQRGTLDMTLHSIPARIDLVHRPQGDVELANNTIPIVTGVDLVQRSLPTTLDDIEISLHYRVNGGSSSAVPMQRGTDDRFRADIPGQTTGSHIDYWLHAGSVLSEHESLLPADAPAHTFSFDVAPDTDFPVIQHVPVDHHARNAEPLLVRAQVQDSHDLQSVQFELRQPPGNWVDQELMRQGVSDIFEARVVLPGRVGTELEYRIVARDAALTPHVQMFPATGSLSLRITNELFETAEKENPLWTHVSLKKSAPDQWHREPQNNTPGGQFCWKLGPNNVSSNPRAGRMELDQDAALVSPAMRLTADWFLAFVHRYYLRLSPPDTEHSAVDGAVVEWQDVEVAQDVLEDRWYPIQPVDGYPNILGSYAYYNPLRGFDCWSGDLDAWRPVQFDQSGTTRSLAGRMIRFRFRCATTPIILYDLPRAGWYIDDITLDPGGGPTAIAIEDIVALREAGGVALSWTARDVVPGESFRVERGDDSGTWTLLQQIAGTVGVSHYVARDTDAPVARDLVYRITLVRDGVDVSAHVVQVTAAPARFHLAQNTPNPFNPHTRIAFELPQRQRATLRIFDVRGRLVRTLLSEELDAGAHWRDWDGTDDSGRRVASGVYLYHLATRSHSATNRMLLLQ